MKDIDFLPQKYREASAQRQSRAWRIAVVAVFGGMIVAAIVGQRGLHRRIETELAQVNAQFIATQGQSAQLSAMEQALAAKRAEAELLTYLRHPWPRTQILAKVFESLPDTIVLSRVRVQRDAIPGTSFAPPAATTPAAAEAAAQAEAKLSPAERDFSKLRNENDATQTVVLLDGISEDDTMLHVYLGTLAASGLFSNAELTSLESGDHSAEHNHARFTARVIVKPGYGQRGGPTTAPEKSTSPQSVTTNEDRETSPLLASSRIQENDEARRGKRLNVERAMQRLNDAREAPR